MAVEFHFYDVVQHALSSGNAALYKEFDEELRT